MRCYTDGIHNTCCFEGDEPDGFYLGKSFSEDAIYGKPGAHMYTDGKGHYHLWYDDEVLDGWYLGGHPVPDVKGEKNPMYGYVFSLEQRAKISNSNKGKHKGELNPSFGKHWYHDGIVKCYIVGECLIGFKPGYKRGEPCLKTEEEINNYIKEKNYSE